jgi:hypothetical protein
MPQSESAAALLAVHPDARFEMYDVHPAVFEINIIDRLVKALPLYHRIVKGDKLSKLMKEKDPQIFNLEIMRYDQEAIRRIMKDLDALLPPERSEEDEKSDEV